MNRLAIVALLALGACTNTNTATGNDTEAGRDRPTPPAPRMGAAQALAGVETSSIQPETMSDAEIASLGGSKGRCVFRLTRVAFPSLVYGPDHATIKLNGKLVTLPRTAPGRFEDAGLGVTVTMTPARTTAASQGLSSAQMVILPPGTRDERGYHGFAECPG